MKRHTCLTFIWLSASSMAFAQQAPSVASVEDEEALALAAIQASGAHTAPEKTPAPAPDNTLETPNEGIELGVTKPDSQNGKNKISPNKKLTTGDVKISAPWPAKPLATPPVGWKLAPAPKGTPVHRETVTLKSGEKVSLSITPYILVPDSDGRSSFRIAEPGYKPSLGLGQTDTVTAVIQRANAEIEKTEKQTSEAIRRLQLLLTSLPKKQQ